MINKAARVTVVSFADAKYFPLLHELAASIRQFYSPEECAISVLDAGLEENQLARLHEYVQDVAKPKWDLEQLPFYRKRKPHQQAFTCLPFLPQYFPGYDIYIWLDADCWVAEPSAIALFIEGAQRGKLAVCLSVDRCYSPESLIKTKLFRQTTVRSFLFKHVKRAFGRRKAKKLAHYPELNTGAFALHRDAPHWKAWAGWMERAAPRARVYGIDQLAASMMIYEDGLPVELLPAWCNWTCTRALPIVDSETGQLLEPYLPHHPLGIVHLAGLDAVRSDRGVLTTLKTTIGETTARSLRFDMV